MDDARDYYNQGVRQLNLAAASEQIRETCSCLFLQLKKCPHSVPLWLLLVRLEEKSGVAILVIFQDIEKHQFEKSLK